MTINFKDFFHFHFFLSLILFYSISREILDSFLNESCDSRALSTQMRQNSEEGALHGPASYKDDQSLTMTPQLSLSLLVTVFRLCYYGSTSYSLQSPSNQYTVAQTHVHRTMSLALFIDGP
ncbi:hypothetical protein VNO77_04106 [Canavalia gladiata]|uniref:Uncharacterized protein n=1 Tax=Canavalia gladiata TaxID=3824 RepID=A0AAN9MW21_CANGL